MWDVSWMDPHRETVGQRKSRKNASSNNNISPKEPVDSSRRLSVLSFSSSDHQTRKPSLLSLFGAGSLSPKKRTKSFKEVHSSAKSIPIEQDEKLSEAAKWVNQLYEISPDDSQSTPEFSPCSPSTQSTIRCNYDTEQSSTSDAAESVFSGWTGRSERTQSTWTTGFSPGSPTKKIPPLNLNSIVPKKDELELSPFGYSKSFEKKMSAMVGIEPPKETSRSRKRTSDTHTTGKTEKSKLSCKNSAGAKSSKIDKKEISQIKSPAQKSEKITAEWKPPDDWNCVPHEEIKTSATKYVNKSWENSSLRLNEKIDSSVPEAYFSQLNIHVMEAASPKIIVQRLQEEWDVITDASIYRGIELQKQLWMLRALREFQHCSRKDPVKSFTRENEKVLSLYENYACASTLSALTKKKVCHLAATPLSPKYYPNVIPRIAPTAITQLPYPAGEFSSIYAFSMPNLFPAQSIPELLRECRRILKSPSYPPSPTLPAVFDSTLRIKTSQFTRGGSLHLTILDPTPIPATMGPCLRNWLDNHLIINLQRKFLCVNPGRLFQVWLADAGLQAEGSKNSHVRFLASVPSSPPVPAVTRNKDVESEEIDENEFTKLQLKSISGRILWKDMWGGYVLGEKWWWEDEEIIKECEKLGTCWEYTEIEAIKEC